MEKQLKLWQREAQRVTGCKTLDELYDGASQSTCRRTKDVCVFFNSNQRGHDHFSIPDYWKEYRDFIVEQPASDEVIGQALRAALDASVEGAEAPPDQD